LPKGLIYDVDRDIEKESIADIIAEQNPRLLIEKEGVGKVIRPLFQKGPRTGPIVHWV